MGKGATALNEALGGVLAVTDRRLLYLARTLVGRQQLERGNELLAVPFSRIRAARFKRGVGVGDVRKIASLTLYGSKLWVTVDMGEILFSRSNRSMRPQRLRKPFPTEPLIADKGWSN